jgi:hypothetical protein
LRDNASYPGAVRYVERAAGTEAGTELSMTYKMQKMVLAAVLLVGMVVAMWLGAMSADMFLTR